MTSQIADYIFKHEETDLLHAEALEFITKAKIQNPIKENSAGREGGDTSNASAR